MVEDNTPTVTSRRRKPTRHMRLRLETVKKLRALGSKRKEAKEKSADSNITVRPVEQTVRPETKVDAAVKARTPRIKKAKLTAPPKPKAKFRKRQIDKTWLPTHMFHAKRARMTTPKEPLWRFAIPLTPTAKSYRPTHRAASEKGAIAWDMSYMSTISLDGQQRSIEGMLKALCFSPVSSSDDPWGSKCERWRNGITMMEGIIFEREAPHKPIAPTAAIWSTLSAPKFSGPDELVAKRNRKLMLRMHPSAFPQVWEELVRLGKVAKPQVSVEDLRYEIGSIEVAGAGATEALVGALWPSTDSATSIAQIAKVWPALAGLTDPSLLPSNVIIACDMQDPRLHHPPRTIKISQNSDEQQRLSELAAAWPLKSEHISANLFDRHARRITSSALSSQKAINRRKSAALPGQFPDAISTDPKIPTMVYSTSTGKGSCGSWTVLLPWKCVQPLWYSILYYPLSSGSQPRFGGLAEKRQLAFEANQAWFPGDYPGTSAGWEWEVEQRKKRKDEWERRPKSKRVNWVTVATGSAIKGEIGSGWACDWEQLLGGPNTEAHAGGAAGQAANEDITMVNGNAAEAAGPAMPVQVTAQPPVTFLPSLEAERLFQTIVENDLPPKLRNPVIIVSLSCLTRGTPQTCARIYRLPSTTTSAHLRRKWLDLHPRNKNQKGPKNSLPRLPKDAPPYLVQRRLAQSLLEPARAGEDDYPSCPAEEDLIGYVTTGNLNLSEGRGTGIGNLLLSKVLNDVRQNRDDGRLCIVRNAGQSVGRLARWTLA